MNQSITLMVNGTEHRLEVPARRLLVDCLRYDLGLTGTKGGLQRGSLRGLHRAHRRRDERRPA